MRLLIADDHDLLRDTLVLYLESEGDFETVGVVDLDEALSKIASDGPFDLILLDYKMPGMHGLAGLRRVISSSGKQRVALISGAASSRVAEQALAAGAVGFLPKTLGGKSIVAAVRKMIAGGIFTPVELKEKAASGTLDRPKPPLSDREVEVLAGLAKGLSNKEIGLALEIREPTVKLHVKSLYRKMAVTNRTQAALAAREQGLV